MGKVKGGRVVGGSPTPRPLCPGGPRGCAHPLEISKKSDGGARAPPHPLQKKHCRSLNLKKKNVNHPVKAFIRKAENLSEELSDHLPHFASVTRRDPVTSDFLLGYRLFTWYSLVIFTCHLSLGPVVHLQTPPSHIPQPFYTSACTSSLNSRTKGATMGVARIADPHAKMPSPHEQAMITKNRDPWFCGMSGVRPPREALMGEPT